MFTGRANVNFIDNNPYKSLRFEGDNTFRLSGNGNLIRKNNSVEVQKNAQKRVMRTAYNSLLGQFKKLRRKNRGDPDSLKLKSIVIPELKANNIADRKPPEYQTVVSSLFLLTNGGDDILSSACDHSDIILNSRVGITKNCNTPSESEPIPEKVFLKVIKDAQATEVLKNDHRYCDLNENKASSSGQPEQRYSSVYSKIDVENTCRDYNSADGDVCDEILNNYVGIESIGSSTEVTAPDFSRDCDVLPSPISSIHKEKSQSEVITSGNSGAVEDLITSLPQRSAVSFNTLPSCNHSDAKLKYYKTGYKLGLRLAITTPIKINALEDFKYSKRLDTKNCSEVFDQKLADGPSSPDRSRDPRIKFPCKKLSKTTPATRKKHSNIAYPPAKSGENIKFEKSNNGYRGCAISINTVETRDLGCSSGFSKIAKQDNSHNLTKCATESFRGYNTTETHSKQTSLGVCSSFTRKGLKRCSIYSNLYGRSPSLERKGEYQNNSPSGQKKSYFGAGAPQSFTLSQQRYTKKMHLSTMPSESVEHFTRHESSVRTPIKQKLIRLKNFLSKRTGRSKPGGNGVYVYDDTRRCYLKYPVIHHKDNLSFSRENDNPKRSSSGIMKKVCDKFRYLLSPSSSQDEYFASKNPIDKKSDEDADNVVDSGEKPCNGSGSSFSILSRIARTIRLRQRLDSDKLLKKKNLGMYRRRYSIECTLSSSGCTRVDKVVDKLTKTVLIAKNISVKNAWSVSISNQTLRGVPLELSMNKFFSNHPLFLKFVGYYDLVDEYVLLTEFMGDRWIDLFSYVDMHGPRNALQTRRIVSSIWKGITHMHSLGIAHNDIKDENVLINIDTLDIKIIDLGSASEITNQPCRVFKGTEKYACPQYFANETYTDMQQESWAFGCLMFVLYFRADPYKGNGDAVDIPVGAVIAQSLRQMWFKNPYSKIDYEYIGFMSLLMSYNPGERPPVSDVHISDEINSNICKYPVTGGAVRPKYMPFNQVRVAEVR